MTFRERFKSKRFRLILLLILVIIIKLISLNSSFIENFYASGFFRGFAVVLRAITGWIPFSLGDIIYLIAGLWLAYKIIRFVIKLFKRKVTWRSFGAASMNLLLICITVYLVFNIFWGLNYNRKGIAFELNLGATNYDTTDLKNIQWLLLKKLNESKLALLQSHASYPSNKELFARASACYRECEKQYPFLAYNVSSVKSSLYGWWGNYLGFSGYYNPFTGEAQVNTTVPKFVLPYTTVHEIAHQLGYAKEDEANFVGYLAATSSSDTLFHYSTYLDLFLYANARVLWFDTADARKARRELLPEVKADILEYREFIRRHYSAVEPVINWLYGKYLKANQQPKGMATYNEVLGNLIAFYKKYGKI